MARYIGPKNKIARKFKDPIFGPVKNLEKKGAQGNRRRKQSEYAVQLEAKQKAKYTYGILEKQFSNLFEKASRSKGITGEILMQLCEARLDNVVYRLGLARTRSGARQFVGHKHITVNGSVVNIPSYSVKVGDIVAVREKSKSLEVVANSVSGNGNSFEWLEFDSNQLAGKVIAVPERDQIPENINEQLIVELYSK